MFPFGFSVLEMCKITKKDKGNSTETARFWNGKNNGVGADKLPHHLHLFFNSSLAVPIPISDSIHIHTHTCVYIYS